MEEEDKRRIKLLLPNLVNEVSPTEILPYLTCLSDMARQQIINCEKRESFHDGMMTLYHHLIRKNRGFFELEVALRKTDKRDLANRLISDTGPHLAREFSLTRSSTSKQHNNWEEMTIYQRKNSNNEHDTYIRDLNVCAFKILDQLDYSGQENWESMAGHLGLSFRECQKIKHNANSSHGEGCTRILLDKCMDTTLGELLGILRNKMDRIDIVNQLEEFTGYKLPQDKTGKQSSQNVQPLSKIQSENINKADKKEKVLDKNVFKTSLRNTDTTGKTEDEKLNDLKVQRQSECAPCHVVISCREKGNALQNEVESDGIKTYGEGTQPFSVTDNNAISSVATSRIYAREEGSLAANRRDANDLREYNAQYQRIHELCSQENNPSSWHISSGSLLTGLDPHAIYQKDCEETPESADRSDEIAMISIGDPKSVHHYARPETIETFSTQSVKLDSLEEDCLDLESILSNKDLDLGSILSNKEEKQNEETQGLKMLSGRNEGPLNNEIVPESDGEIIDEDTVDETHTNQQLSDSTTSEIQHLPNWDMLRSEIGTVTSTDLEGSSSKFDSSNSSNGLTFLKEIVTNLPEREPVDINSNDESSQPPSPSECPDLQSKCGQNQTFVINGNKNVFITFQGNDKEHNYTSLNNNSDFIKDEYNNSEQANLEAKSNDNRPEENGNQVSIDEEELNPQVAESTPSSVKFLRNTMFVAGGAFLASLAYKSLKS